MWASRDSLGSRSWLFALGAISIVMCRGTFYSMTRRNRNLELPPLWVAVLLSAPQTRFLLFHFTSSLQCWAKANTETTHSCAFLSHFWVDDHSALRSSFFFFFFFYFSSSKRLSITKGETTSCMQWLIMSCPSLVFSFFERMFLRFLHLWFTKQAVGPVSFNTRHGPRAKYTPGWVDRLHAWCTCTCALMSCWMGGRWNQVRYTKQSRMKIPKEQQ